MKEDRECVTSAHALTQWLKEVLRTTEMVTDASWNIRKKKKWKNENMNRSNTLSFSLGKLCLWSKPNHYCLEWYSNRRYEERSQTSSDLKTEIFQALTSLGWVLTVTQRQNFTFH